MRLAGGVRLAKTYKKEAGRSVGPEAAFQLFSGDFVANPSASAPDESKGSRLEGTHDPWTCAYTYGLTHIRPWVNFLFV